MIKFSKEKVLLLHQLIPLRVQEERLNGISHKENPEHLSAI